MVYICKIPSPAGMLTLSSAGTSVTGLWIEGQKYYGGTLDKKMLKSNGMGAMELKTPEEAGGIYEITSELPVFKQAEKWLDAYFSGKEPGELPELEPAGSEFRRMVWEILCAIPRGQTASYGEIANRIAARTGKDTISARAVGGAVGHNPISIMIPCHRVMGGDGSLTGYAGGLEVKKMLLALEGDGNI